MRLMGLIGRMMLVVALLALMTGCPSVTLQGGYTPPVDDGERPAQRAEWSAGISVSGMSNDQAPMTKPNPLPRCRVCNGRDGLNGREGRAEMLPVVDGLKK